MRIVGCIEYCGKQYCGWQYQHHVLSVQQVLQQAVAKVANHPVTVFVAGRTDAGVHSSGQVFHFDSDSERTMNDWLRGINSLLPADVALVWVSPVTQDFHARFSAMARSYRYIILNRQVRASYLSGLVTWYRSQLSVDDMHQAAQQLVGAHNFEAYRSVVCQSKTPNKEIYQIDVRREGQWLWIDVRANGFLHHMVRNIVGVLVEIGDGRRAVSWAQEVLQSQSRAQGGVTAPADGLYLCAVEYDAKFNIPPPPQTCRFW